MRRSIATMVGAVATIGGLVAACGPPVGLFFGGDGDGTTPPFTLADGSYHIRWSYHDPNTGDHGCLFGLAIRLQDPLRAAPDRRATLSNRKLVYRSIGPGMEAAGDAQPVSLVAGTYVFVAEGACAWEAQILPADPDAAPLENE